MGRTVLAIATIIGWALLGPESGSAFQAASPLRSARVVSRFPTSPSVKPLVSYTSCSSPTLYSAAAASEEPAEEVPVSPSGGTATQSELIFNLVKGIVGAGVLTLPSGIAAFGNAPSAAIPAVAMIAIIGGLSGYGFGLIGRVCSLTKTTSYRDAWSASVNEKSSWIPAISVLLKTISAVLAYSIILAQTGQSLALSAGLTISKTVSLGAITGGLLLPLCLLKDLSSLAPFSLLGSMGMIYTAIAMAIRYFGKAYTSTGKFATDLPAALRPSFGSVGAAGALSPSSAILLAMLSTAYMAHFNAPKFFTELKDNTVPRYLTVVATSFGVSISLFAGIAALGFLTFGGACSGLILNNYSTADSLMSLSRIAVATSIILGYPLAFTGARDGLLDVFKIKDRSNKMLNTVTVGLLTGISLLAMVVPDVSFVLALAGATLGNALIYVFPGLMFRGAIKKVASPTRLQKNEVMFALTSAAVGVGLGAMGAFKAIQSVL